MQLQNNNYLILVFFKVLPHHINAKPWEKAIRKIYDVSDVGYDVFAMLLNFKVVYGSVKIERAHFFLQAALL